MKSGRKRALLFTGLAAGAAIALIGLFTGFVGQAEDERVIVEPLAPPEKLVDKALAPGVPVDERVLEFHEPSHLDPHLKVGPPEPVPDVAPRETQVAPFHL